MDERRLNIILRIKDQEHIAVIQRDTGETTAVGAIRAALRRMAREIKAYTPPSDSSPLECESLNGNSCSLDGGTCVGESCPEFER